MRKSRLNPRGRWIEVTHDELVSLCAVWQPGSWCDALVAVRGRERGERAFRWIEPYSEDGGEWRGRSFEAFVARLVVDDKAEVGG